MWEAINTLVKDHPMIGATVIVIVLVVAMERRTLAGMIFAKLKDESIGDKRARKNREIETLKKIEENLQTTNTSLGKVITGQALMGQSQGRMETDVKDLTTAVTDLGKSEARQDTSIKNIERRLDSHSEKLGTTVHGS